MWNPLRVYSRPGFEKQALKAEKPPGHAWPPSGPGFVLTAVDTWLRLAKISCARHSRRGWPTSSVASQGWGAGGRVLGCTSTVTTPLPLRGVRSPPPSLTLPTSSETPQVSVRWPVPGRRGHPPLTAIGLPGPAPHLSAAVPLSRTRRQAPRQRLASPQTSVGSIKIRWLPIL